MLAKWSKSCDHSLVMHRHQEKFAGEKRYMTTQKGTHKHPEVTVFAKKSILPKS